MSLRALIIDDDAKAEAARVLKHAEANHYHPKPGDPEPGQPTPGDNPAFVAKLGSFRAVFTITHLDGAIWRHLTISVPKRDKYPHPFAAYTIAGLFGFTGWNEKTATPPEDWLTNVNTRENCILIAQPIGTERGH